MHYHSNYMYCNSCHWTNDSFDSRHLVSIEQHRRDVKFKYNEKEDIDWQRLIVVTDEIDMDRYEHMLTSDYYEKYTDKQKRAMAIQECPNLKPEVLDWLNTNVLPPKSKADFKEQPWGWAMHNTSTRIMQHSSLDLFFYRRSDAMLFIKTWSHYKKPTTYFNYFSGVNKAIDERGKLVNVKKKK